MQLNLCRSYSNRVLTNLMDILGSIFEPGYQGKTTDSMYITQTSHMNFSYAP